LPVQFVDFAYWQKSLESRGLLDNDLAYWYNEVVSSTPPVILDVPIDKPRPRVWMAIGASQRCLYDNELLTPLAEITGRATPMAVTCTNFAIVLSRFTGISYLDVAIPFALRNMPALINLIGNFLNMMPVRMKHDSAEPYSSTLERVAISNLNVQKYSLGQFIQLVEATRKHFPMQDPSRNPIYATMVDLVPNETGSPSTGLSGVLDVFLFVNTRQGVIWSVDAVYNTTILEEQTVRTMLLQMPAIARHAARCGREPVPRSLPSREEAQPAQSTQIELTSLMLQVGLLPHIMPMRSGWELEGLTSEYYGVRHAKRLKRHSGLQLTAELPPAPLLTLRPPPSGGGGGGSFLAATLQPRPPMAAAAASGQLASSAALGEPRAPTRTLVMPAGAEAKAKATKQQQWTQVGLPHWTPEVRRGQRHRTVSKLRTYEVAARRAESQRVSELIPLDSSGLSTRAEPLEEIDRQLLQRGRRGPAAAGRGRTQ